MQPNPPPALPPRPESTPFPYWIPAIFLVGTILFCGIVGYFFQHASQRLFQTPQSFEKDWTQIQDFEDSLPEIDSVPVWHGDELSVKLTFKSSKKEFAHMKVDELLLDNYLPDKKTPFKVPPFGPKEPVTMEVKFPGFDGRGGKYAKFHLHYEMPGGEMKMPEIGPKPPGDVVIPSDQGTFSSGIDPALYIPLRGSAKKHALRH